MSNDIFDSSDSVRNARPLQYAQYVTFDEPLDLELGEQLPQVTVAYETYGRLSAKRGQCRFDLSRTDRRFACGRAR